MGLKNKWTPQDEAALKGLVARKEAFESEAKAPLTKFVVQHNLRIAGDAFSLKAHLDTVALLTANADALRDALAPFDSGTRKPGPAAEEGR
jgi:hypothetical protein